MYLNKQNLFKTHYKVAISIERARVKNIMGLATERDWNKAWNLYCNSRNPHLNMMVFGRFREYAGGWIGPAEKQNFGIIDGNAGAAGGSVQSMPGTEWNLHVNDAWLLGGVHTYRPFYAASPLTAEICFRNDAHQGLGITGRELVALLMAGYRPVSNNPKLGTVMVCRDRRKAANLSLLDIENEVDTHENNWKSNRRYHDLTMMAIKAGIMLY